MSIFCLIPARGGSKGIPKKNLVNIGGRPLVDWSILCAKQSGLFEQIAVSSDSEEILDRARIHQVTAVLRPVAYASDDATSESALLHAARELGIQPSDLVVFLQPTSPLRAPSDLRTALRKYGEGRYDSLLSVSLVKDRFIWEVKGDQSESINYDWRNRQRRQEILDRYLENGSFYVFRVGLLYETGNRLGGRIGMSVMDRWKELQIDSPEDIEIADILVRTRLIQEWNPG